MKSFCTKCKINWSRLWTCGEDENQVEFCPQCLTDFYLIEGKQEASFIKSPISGKIIDIETKKEMIIEVPLPSYFRKTRNRPAMTPTAAALEERDNRALEAYHLSGNKEDFFKEYNRITK